MVKVREDLTGRRFGRLVVLEQTEDHISCSGEHISQWLCQCDCGKQTVVTGNRLKSGNTTSCGCAHIEAVRGLVAGVGIYDGPVGMGWDISNPIYGVWKQMLYRGYSMKQKKKAPTYKDTTVYQPWHLYSNFEQWYLANSWYDGDESVAVDKDFLFKSNKEYHPDKCVLMPQSLNALLLKNNAQRGKYPIGVCKTSNGKFRASLGANGHLYHLGTFVTPEEAFQAYKKAKEQHIKDVADEYKAKYPDFPQKLYDAMYAYEVEITD